jgi:hypothetical protein
MRKAVAAKDPRTKNFYFEVAEATLMASELILALEPRVSRASVIAGL